MSNAMTNTTTDNPSGYDSVYGNPRTWGNNQYQVSNFQYPSDLSSNSNRYGNNYVVFNINVPIDSKIKANADGSQIKWITNADIKNQVALATINRDASGQEVSGAKIKTLAAQGGIAALKIADNIVRKKTDAAAGIDLKSGVTSAAAVAMADTMSRQTRRLDAAIMLHVPNDLTIGYGMNWSEEDMDEFAAMQQGFRTPSTIGGIAGAMGLKGTPGLSVMTGMAANPKREQLFKGVDFRTFQFNYQFFPRNEIESRNVKNIIKTFKLHMHPEFKDTGQFIFVYPSEFEITYYSNGKENTWLHRHLSCVLTKMSVNYTPNASFSTHEDGSPTQINVSLEFKELGILTKQHIADEF